MIARRKVQGSWRHGCAGAASLFAAALVSGSAAAETAPAAPAAAPAAPAPAAPAPAPEAKPTPWTDLVKIEGQVDAYYSQRLGLESGVSTLAPAEARVFDLASNSFHIGAAKLALTTQTAPVSLRVDLLFGLAGGLVSPAPFDHIEQAYASYTLPWGKNIVVDAGRFATWVGSEVIEAKDNWLYSRSLVFYASPFTHTGVRVTAPINDALTVKFAIINGWDVVVDNNNSKSLAASLAYTAPSATSIALTTIQGPEDTGTAGPWRQFYDLVVAQPLGDKLTLNLNGILRKETAGTAFAASLMAQYLISDSLKVSVRGEYLADSDHLYFSAPADPTAKDMNVYEGTVSLGMPVGKNAEFRLEVRHDQASAKIFQGGATDSQNTAQLAALAWF